MSQRIDRTEHDLLGNKLVPMDAHYGMHTLRAVENLPITDTPISIYSDLINALTNAVVHSCEDIRTGREHLRANTDSIISALTPYIGYPGTTGVTAALMQPRLFQPAKP